MTSGSNGDRMWTSSACGLRRSPAPRARRNAWSPSSLDGHRHQLLLPHPGLDHASPVSGVTAQLRVHHREALISALRAQRPVEQVGRDLPLRCSLGARRPAEMAVHQLVGLHHADPLRKSSARRCRSHTAARASMACGCAQGWSFSTSSSVSMSRIEMAPSLRMAQQLLQVVGVGIGIPAQRRGAVLLSSR